MCREKMATSRGRRKEGKSAKAPISPAPVGAAIRMTDWDNAAYSNCPECQWSVSTSKIVPPGLAFHPEQDFNRQGAAERRPLSIPTPAEDPSDRHEETTGFPWANTYFRLNDFTLGRLWETPNWPETSRGRQTEATSSAGRF